MRARTKKKKMQKRFNSIAWRARIEVTINQCGVEQVKVHAAVLGVSI